MSRRYIAAIDQGTTSSRCMVFDARRRHRRRGPEGAPPDLPAAGLGGARRPGDLDQCRDRGRRRPGQAGDRRRPISPAVGITNQRETTVLWDKATGRPIANAIVWQDTRTDRAGRRARRARAARTGSARSAGLPLATYFSGPKIRWLLDNVDGARAAAERGEVLFGTMDTWLIWKLTGRHVTDVTNASRTMLMNLATLDWDDELLDAIGVPRAMLPQIRSSAEVYGEARGVLAGVAGRLGARRPAGGPVRPDLLFARRGQVHLRHRQLPAGQHRRARRSPRTTACSPPSATGSARRPAVYALEGSIAVTGALVQWLRDNLGLISAAGGDRGAGRERWPTTAAAISCRRSPASSRPTGAPTRAA